MNTDTVTSLAVTATKPAASDGTQKRHATASAAPPQASVPKPASSIVDTRTVEETTAAVARQLESYLRSVGRNVEFSIDTQSGETVVSVRDANTGGLIRQIPSEEALRLAKALTAKGNSLVDVTA